MNLKIKLNIKRSELSFVPFKHFNFLFAQFPVASKLDFRVEREIPHSDSLEIDDFVSQLREHSFHLVEFPLVNRQYAVSFS